MGTAWESDRPEADSWQPRNQTLCGRQRGRLGPIQQSGDHWKNKNRKLKSVWSVVQVCTNVTTPRRFTWLDDTLIQRFLNNFLLFLTLDCRPVQVICGFGSFTANSQRTECCGTTLK